MCYANGMAKSNTQRDTNNERSLQFARLFIYFSSFLYRRTRLSSTNTSHLIQGMKIMLNAYVMISLDAAMFLDINTGPLKNWQTYTKQLFVSKVVISILLCLFICIYIVYTNTKTQAHSGQVKIWFKFSLFVYLLTKQSIQWQCDNGMENLWENSPQI